MGFGDDAPKPEDDGKTDEQRAFEKARDAHYGNEFQRAARLMRDMNQDSGMSGEVPYTYSNLRFGCESSASQ